MTTTTLPASAAHYGGASPAFLRRRAFWNRVSTHILLLAAVTSVLVTVGIVYVLISESIPFFREVKLWDFLTDTQWTPVFEDAHFGVMTLVSATVTVAGIALAVAIPAGLILAIYLSEFASPRVRETIKPFLELLEGVPTVVYGFFALLLVTPLLLLAVFRAVYTEVNARIQTAALGLAQGAPVAALSPDEGVLADGPNQTAGMKAWDLWREEIRQSDGW